MKGFATEYWHRLIIAALIVGIGFLIDYSFEDHPSTEEQRLARIQFWAHNLDMVFAETVGDKFLADPRSPGLEDIQKLFAVKIRDPKIIVQNPFNEKPTKYIPLGADPEPGTYTLLYCTFPSSEATDFPHSWEVAIVVFGEGSQSMLNEILDVDTNRDGFADPVIHYWKYICSFGPFQNEIPIKRRWGYNSDANQRWTALMENHFRNICTPEDMSQILIANGYDHPHDEPLPELPKNWWKED